MEIFMVLQTQIHSNMNGLPYLPTNSYLQTQRNYSRAPTIQCMNQASGVNAAVTNRHIILSADEARCIHLNSYSHSCLTHTHTCAPTYNIYDWRESGSR